MTVGTTATTAEVPAATNPPRRPFFLQLNAGFGAMFSGLGGGLELGFLSEHFGVGGFFNLGYFLSAAGGESPGAVGYGGGARLLAGGGSSFGYIAVAYSLVKTISADVCMESCYDVADEQVWGPSLLFGYQYTATVFRFFADIGVSSVGGAYFPGDDLTGALFTLDLGIGFRLGG